MVTGVSFVGVLVNDIEEAQRTYAGLLEVEPWAQGVMEMPGVKVVMFPLGDCFIELLQPTVGPESAVGGDLARRLEKGGEGVCRLGLRVDNLEEELKRLKAAGVRVLETGHYGRIGESLGARMAFVHPKSASGVLIELDQQMQKREVHHG